MTEDTAKTLTREEIEKHRYHLNGNWDHELPPPVINALCDLALVGLEAGEREDKYEIERRCPVCLTWNNDIGLAMRGVPSPSPGAQEEQKENPLWMRGIDYDTDDDGYAEAHGHKITREVIQGEVGKEFPAKPFSPVAPASELLADLNRAQNTRGIGAWVKDVIQRAYAALTRLQQEVAWRDAERNNMLNEADAKDEEIARLTNRMKQIESISRVALDRKEG